MKVDNIMDDAHTQMSEVIMGMMELFNTTDLREVAPYTPLVLEIMNLPRTQRKSVGLGIVSEFFLEHAINIEDPLQRREYASAVPFLVWSIEHARGRIMDQAEQERAEESVQEAA